MDFSQELIIERFSYNNQTGEITNKKVNRVVTSKDQDGYIVCSCFHDGKNGRMRGARLVWVMHFGDIPSGYIVDHKNRIRDDNRLENLRLATLKENAANADRKDKSKYTSEYKGVQLDKWGRWQASIQTDGVTTQLGKFSTEEAAAYAYNVEALARYGEFAKLNNVAPLNLLDYLSERNKDFLNEERRGLPKNTVKLGSGDILIRVDNKTLARFKNKDINDAITCAEHFNKTGEILDMKTNIVEYNKYGLPNNITPCSTGYRVSICEKKVCGVKQVRHHVGTFKTLEEAVEKLSIKKKELNL